MMELKRVVGRLAPRWRTLLLAGLIGAVGAFVFVDRQNNAVEPVYTATAVVAIPAVVETDGRGSSGAPSTELTDAHELARATNEAELRTGDRAIIADPNANSLTFSATDDTELAALGAATSMRLAYVNADPIFDVDAGLAAKLAEATLIEKRLDELIPVVPGFVSQTPEEAAAAEAQLNRLQAQRGAIEAKMTELTDTKVESTDAEEIAALDKSLDGYQTQLTELLVVLLPLEKVAADLAAAEAAANAPEGDPTTDQDGTEFPDLPVADQWTIQALQERLATLETESAPLIVSSETGAGPVLAAGEVIDETPSVLPAWLGIVVGFLAGAILWSAVLLAFDRARGLVWQAGDVKNVDVLAEMPSAPLDARNLTDLERQRRKRSIQAIRSAIIAAGGAGRGSIVGFAAPQSTESRAQEELAYDVARSLGAVGRSVLVVDLGFSDLARPGFESSDATGLRELFQSANEDEMTIRERAEATIASAQNRGLGLDVLVANSDFIDPADLLAGRPVSALLEQSRRLYDVVLVIQPSTSVTAGAGIDAYLQQQVIVCTRGKTRVSEIAAQSIQGRSGMVQMVGVVILNPEISGERGSGGGPIEPTEPESDTLEDHSEYSVYQKEKGMDKLSSAFRRLVSSDPDVAETTLERIRSLEAYSVEESALLQASEGPSDPG
ncbi:MAG TPA: hypothetical protein VIW94_10890 [Acidimicrobiia bacterium]